MIKVGDFVEGTPGSPFSVTTEKMTRGLVRSVDGEQIRVTVLDHTEGKTGGTFPVDAIYFKVVGHVKPFNREDVFKLLLKGCKKAILEYDLSGANLRGADLRGANLSGADLSDANLSRANLRGANLSGADLSDANLSRANLRGANLSGADLRGANLSGADLRDANLSGANLRDANLSRANLRRADLSGANLRRADLSGADLRDADLRDADLDFSCWPLWCGGLHVKADIRHAYQLAYHLCTMQCGDAEYMRMRNSILPFANRFHRAHECGVLEESPVIIED